MNKKGQGISINVIIIAAIAILVLVILAILIARSGGDMSDATKCIGKGGTCKIGCSDIIPDTTGTCKTGVCCSPIPLT